MASGTSPSKMKPDLNACDDPAVRELLEMIGQFDALGRKLG